MQVEKRVLVVGDRMADLYWVGTADRLSPEAPVPVVKITASFSTPGGAGNVVANLAALGEQVGWVFGGGTPLKHRLMVGDRQVARWDQDDWCSGIGWEALQKGLATAKAVVVSDYRKGSITLGTPTLIADAGLPTFVDTKANPKCWLGSATVVFPNEKEYTEYQEVYDKFRLVVLKRGSKGMELRSYGKLWAAEPAGATQVCSVNGAGDSVIAGFVSEYLRNGCLESMANRALRFAAAAAAIAVERPYTASVERAAVEARMRRQEVAA